MSLSVVDAAPSFNDFEEYCQEKAFLGLLREELFKVCSVAQKVFSDEVDPAPPFERFLETELYRREQVLNIDLPPVRPAPALPSPPPLPPRD